MTLLAPYMLWALAALVIPVAIHLFDFQRPRRVYFSQVQFLKRVEQSTSAIRKLKHYLVLAMRLLAFAALVLAFAQPVILPSGAALRRLEATSIYIDNSYSMQANRQGQPALDLAVKAAEQLILAGKADQRYQVLSNEFDANSQYFYTQGEALDRVRQIAPSSTFRSASEVLKRQQASFTSEGLGSGNCYWLTDAQRSTMGNLTNLRADSLLPVTVVPITPEETPNLYVDTMYLTQPLHIPGQSSELVVGIRNAGAEAVKNQVIRLFINEVQVSTASASVGPGDKGTVTFTYKAEGSALAKGRISFDDEPINFDNDYYFVINPLSKLRIATIAQTEGNTIAKVFDNPALFDAKSYSLANVDYQFAGEADLLVLYNIKSWSSGLQAVIGKQVQAGHTVIIFPDADGNSASALAQATGGGVTFLKDSARTGLPISMPGAKNPFYEGVFESLPQNATLPTARPAYALLGGNPVLSFSNGQAFLTSYRRGNGRVLLAASPMVPSRTDFYRHALFVPTLLRAALQSRDATSRLAWSFQNRSITLPQPDNMQVGESGLKLRSGKTELIPAHRVVNNQLILELPGTPLPAGYYELLAGEKPLYNLAFNYGRQESQLDFYTIDELRNSLPGSAHFTIANQLDNAAAIRGVRQDQAGIPLWPWLLGLALLALLVEILLLRFLK